jgi:DNA-binding NtrC family response regulator
MMPTTKPKLVIIDDEISVCETLKIAFSDLFKVAYFCDLKDAKSFLEKNKDIALMLLDYKIRHDSGIEFFKKEVLAKNLNIPTILISGFLGQEVNEGDKFDLNKMFVKTLEKPFDLYELKDFIETKILKIKVF